METTHLVIGGVAVLFLVVVALNALLQRRNRGGGPDHAAIRQYREWQGQAMSWTCYYELEDMIDEERAKGA